MQTARSVAIYEQPNPIYIEIERPTNTGYNVRNVYVKNVLWKYSLRVRATISMEFLLSTNTSRKKVTLKDFFFVDFLHMFK